MDQNSKPKIYIAGPMTGYEDFNHPAFFRAEEALMELGYEVVNPARVTPDQSTPWAECMKRAIPALIECNAIWMMPGWRLSRGARLEFQIAIDLGMSLKGAV